METGLLHTKLYIPAPRPALVERPHLTERLNGGLAAGYKLTLLSAPAGFGKTTLLSSWIAGLRFPTEDARTGAATRAPVQNRVAWLALDAADSDPARFLSYLIAALQTVAPDVGTGALAALQSPQPPPIETLLTPLLNEIAALSAPSLLVLDDYHALDSTAIDDALAFLLDHLPPHFHLVIASREDPNLPLSRLRARGQLTELRAADLRFTPVEAAAFLNQVMGLDLSAENVAALESRTEGWIAGLQLAALSLRAQADPTAFVRSFTGSHRFVLDYLLEEVLHHQSKEIQTFLLHTSILDRLCGPLCETLLQNEDGIEVQPASLILHTLERANLFIVSLDDERRWYRYHHLFGDLLRQRLGQSLSAAEVAALHLRASVWYERHGDQATAFDHALAAGDFSRAADLAESAWSVMFRSYVQNTLFLDWMKALPDALIRSRPVLCAGYGWALLDMGELEAAESWLQIAERWLLAGSGSEWVSGSEMVVVDREEFQMLPASITLARAYLAMARGKTSSVVRQARQTLELLEETDTFRRAGVAALLGIAYLSNGELEAATNAISEGMALAESTGSHAMALTGTFPLADVRLVQGRLAEAERVYTHALQGVLEQSTPGLPGTADLYLGLARIYLERDDLETVESYLQQSTTLAEQTRSPDWARRYYLVHARLQEARGDLEGALTLLEEAEQLSAQNPLPEIWPVAALKARVWIKQGHLSGARKWTQQRGLSAADSLTFLREYEHLTLARLLYHQDQAETLALLERLLRAAEEGGRPGRVIEILILQALAHQAQGALPGALAALSRALSLAEPEGYVRVFVEEGAPMVELLGQVRAKDDMQEAYVRQLLAHLGGAEPHPSSFRHYPLVEPLSERELEVLGLLKTELSGPDIAQELSVSLNTLRTHTKSIYSKLAVHNRRAAVRRAEEHGLL